MYKKAIFLLAVALVAALALGTTVMAAPAPASTEQGNTPAQPGLGTGLRIGQRWNNGAPPRTALSVLANLSGIDLEEVMNLRRQGKSLAEIAESQGITEDELVKAIMDTRKEVLAKLVEDGKITQEQADFCLENMEERITENIDRVPTGPANRAGSGRGAGQGRGGRRGSANRGICLRTGLPAAQSQ